MKGAFTRGTSLPRAAPLPCATHLDTTITFHPDNAQGNRRTRANGASMGTGAKPHVTAIASTAASAMARFTVPLRALIEAGIATADVCIGPQKVAIVPGSPVLIDGTLSLPEEFAQLARRHGCRLIVDFDRVPEHAFDISQADIVTAATQPLARALTHRGCEPVVIPDVVDPRDWTIAPRRAPRQRLRAGWFGDDEGPFDDLALLDDMTRALAGQVDFAFFGTTQATCAAGGNRVERYIAVPPGAAARMLAALDLDVVLVPPAAGSRAAGNAHRRILQAGMLGYAVLASDIEPHREFPVTLLPNDALAWITALRERMHDRSAVRREAALLQAAVARDRGVGRWTARHAALWIAAGVPAVAAHG